jgi:hypothetical protein
MITIQEIRQEIRDVLDKHRAVLVVQHPDRVEDEECWIDVEVRSPEWIGSTQLY